MYILAFETTGPICSVALIDLEDRSKVYVSNDAAPMSHLKNLTEMAKGLMEKEGVSTRDISAVAASVGPGSFTGIRIGVTTARAVAQALDIPCIQAPTLEVFKLKDGGKEKASCDDSADSANKIIVPILNARRGQVYGAIFLSGKDILAPGPYMLEDVLEKLCSYISSDEYKSLYSDKKIEVIFYGDGIDAYMDRLTAFRNELNEKNSNAPSVIFSDENDRYQTADLVAEFAAEKFVKGETVSVSELLPDYMRKAEAEQKLEDGTLKKLREEKLARLMSGN